MCYSNTQAIYQELFKELVFSHIVHWKHALWGHAFQTAWFKPWRLLCTKALKNSDSACFRRKALGFEKVLQQSQYTKKEQKLKRQFLSVKLDQAVLKTKALPCSVHCKVYDKIISYKRATLWQNLTQELASHPPKDTDRSFKAYHDSALL